MSERITNTQGADVARIATSMADTTTGEVLKALHAAWKAGYNAGRAAGYVEGQACMAEVTDTIYDTIYKAMGL